MYDFLPAFLNEDPQAWPYTGYKPEVNPAICPLFAAAAFRYQDTLIPAGLFLRNPRAMNNVTGGFMMRDEGGRTGGRSFATNESCGFRTTGNGFDALSLCHHWWHPTDLSKDVRVEQLLTGMTSQMAQRDDMQICAEMRSEWDSSS